MDNLEPQIPSNIATSNKTGEETHLKLPVPISFEDLFETRHKLGTYLMGKYNYLTEADVEDLLQGVFFNLSQSKKLDEVLADSHYARNWVVRAATNALIDKQRKVNRRPGESHIDDPNFSESLLPHTESVEHTVQRKLDEEEALALLRSLPSKQRQVMVAKRMLGQTHEEIAAEMNTPVGTVKTGVSRSLKALGRKGEELKQA